MMSNYDTPLKSEVPVVPMPATRGSDVSILIVIAAAMVNTSRRLFQRLPSRFG